MMQTVSPMLSHHGTQVIDYSGAGDVPVDTVKPCGYIYCLYCKLIMSQQQQGQLHNFVTIALS